jgi:hypothetical protein
VLCFALRIPSCGRSAVYAFPRKQLVAAVGLEHIRRVWSRVPAVDSSTDGLPLTSRLQDLSHLGWPHMILRDLPNAAIAGDFNFG